MKTVPLNFIQIRKTQIAYHLKLKGEKPCNK